MKGVIIIAVGEPIYGKMAFNLAVSIKHNSRIPVCVLYTPSAFVGNENLLSVFDKKLEYPDTDTPVKLAMKLKTSLGKITQFDRSLFLDADCIMSPTHSVDEWFDELAGIPFTAYNNAIYELGSDPYPYYKFWAKPDDIREHYALRTTDKIPQINSSFIYFEQGSDSARIFDEASRLVVGSKLKHEDFRGEFPDELAFNIACCLTGIMPHKETYRPIYLYILSETVSKEYIIENFGALSIIGNDIKDTRVCGYYNDFVDYYSDIAGYPAKFYYTPKKVDQQRRIFGYYHVCAINGYEKVVEEQIADLINSGLYRAAEKIYVTVCGEHTDKACVLFSGLKKFELCIIDDDRYEFPSIELLQSDCDSDEKMWIFYIHTKGVSYLDGRGDYWRQFMMYFNVEKWKDCIQKLRDGHETVGIKLLEAKSHYPKHYSGNFWWATSEYIKRLPKVSELNQQDRFQAEFWICSGSPNAASLCQLNIDYENKPNYK